MSMQSVISPANILTPAKRTSLTHIPGDEGWPIVGRTLAILADPKGEVERMAAKLEEQPIPDEVDGHRHRDEDHALLEPDTLR